MPFWTVCRQVNGRRWQLSEIFYQPICTSHLQLITTSPHRIRVRSRNVITAITDHDAMPDSDSFVFQQMCDQLGLMVQRPSALRPVDTYQAIRQGWARRAA